MLATMLLPGGIFARWAFPLIWARYRKKVHYWVYATIGTFWFEYLGAFIAYWFLFNYDSVDFPSAMINPVLAVLWMTALILAELTIGRYFWPEVVPEEPQIEFMSARVQYKLPSSEVLYIESRDAQTIVHTKAGLEYPTSMRISSWVEQQENWLRTHRSFLVNPVAICGFTTTTVHLQRDADTVEIPISRSYREAVAAELSA